MFLKLGGVAGESKVKKHTKEIELPGYRNRTRHANQGPSGVPVREEHSRTFWPSSARVDEGHLHHSGMAERERFAVKRVLVFAVEVATGAAVCAGTILAIFAWTGASL